MSSGDDDSRGPQQRLADLLIYGQETLTLEYKGWLDLRSAEHKANLAKACMALENYGGGHVVIGFNEESGLCQPDEDGRPDDVILEALTQDRVNGLLRKYADPPFHCELRWVPHPETDALYPIVCVAGQESVPIRCCANGPNNHHLKENTYYTRLSGPESAAPRSGSDWQNIVDKCIANRETELVLWLRGMAGGGAQAPSEAPSIPTVDEDLEEWTGACAARRDELCSKAEATTGSRPYAHGFWEASYLLNGDIPKLSVTEFRDALMRVQGSLTGWPAWLVVNTPEAGPYAIAGLMECWLGARTGLLTGSGHDDFWRASPEGKLYISRGYQEDHRGDSPFEAGTHFDLTLPLWRAGECVLHARRLASALGDPSATVHLTMGWHGLDDRTLVSWANARRTVFPGRTSRTASVTGTISYRADSAEASVVDIVKQLTEDLYPTFDFMVPLDSMYEEELGKLVRRG